MNRHDQWSGAIGILIGLAFCIASASLGLGTLHQPGPGFLPFLVGSALLFLSAIILVPALRKKEEAKGERMAGGMGKYRKGGLILLALMFYKVALSFLGFTVTTFLFVAFLMKMVETQRWPRTLITALCSAVGFYVVFQSWLRLDLPVGPWRF